MRFSCQQHYLKRLFSCLSHLVLFLVFSSKPLITITPLFGRPFYKPGWRGSLAWRTIHIISSIPFPIYVTLKRVLFSDMFHTAAIVAELVELFSLPPPLELPLNFIISSSKWHIQKNLSFSSCSVLPNGRKQNNLLPLSTSLSSHREKRHQNNNNKKISDYKHTDTLQQNNHRINSSKAPHPNIKSL